MAPRAKQVEIWCGVLGDDSVFSVKIACNATVEKLRLAIAKRVHVAAHRLKLFMLEDPHVGDKRLTDDANLDLFLRQDRVPESGFKEMVPMWKLNSAQCFGSTFPTREHELHVLVKLRDNQPPAKRQRVNMIHEAHGKSLNWIVVPNRFLEGSGVYPSTFHGDLVLYQRSAFQGQWTMMQTCAMDAGAVLYIVGPSGAGKASAAFAFACSQVDRTQWIVVWIHYDQPFYQFCLIKLDGDKKATTVVRDAADITAVLRALETPRRGVVVFYDGYVEWFELPQEMHTQLAQWHDDNPQSRRFICVPAMTVLGKWYKSGTYPMIETPAPWPPKLSTGVWPEDCVRIIKFDVTSWILDEYMKAVQNDRFYDSVEIQLDASAEAQDAQETPVTTRARRVMTKYGVAGGSARFMFYAETDCAKQAVRYALESLENKRDFAEDLMSGATQYTRHRLVACYIRNGICETELVSMYAAQQLARFVDRVGRIDSFRKLLTVNPALDGQLFKGWFFVSLASCGLTYYDREAEKVREWKTSVLHFFDPVSEPFHFYPGWNVPVKWNHAGYDAVHWEVKPATERQRERRRVMLVHITRAVKHHYDLDLLLMFVNRLNERVPWAPTPREMETAAPPVHHAELCFVVPISTLASFRAPMVLIDVLKHVIAGVHCKIRVVGVGYHPGH